MYSLLYSSDQVQSLYTFQLNSKTKRYVGHPDARKASANMLYNKGSQNDFGNFQPISFARVDGKALSKCKTHPISSQGSPLSIPQ
ncbi:uncharacterized protein PHALS_12800 [Plasmopara halstedii]|uniref:Uncharacterized protein n=1 Tax=Plasmopara halstedii TaxID=4781 RepID=A0A0P1ANW9_PLAHL|nr:uncharacterized protein PHALS_12800 [Plasmopara halstedii]CEG42534.1 hypothetical protein PHALS_12800 [Plasmopara halstedii]|eukprot:XP_024578903.1 hypothetical protein PHALS_12800 [Plasmopara halstedii]